MAKRPPRTPKPSQLHAVKAAANRRRRTPAAEVSGAEAKPPPQVVGVVGSVPLDFLSSVGTDEATHDVIRRRERRGADVLASGGSVEPIPTAVLAEPPTQVATVTAAEADAMRRRIDELEATLRELAPIVAEIEEARRRGVGGNQPPIFDSAHVEEGISAANVFRTQISAEQPNSETIRLCGLVFSRLAKEVQQPAFVEGVRKGAGFAAGKYAIELLLPKLVAMLTGIAAKIWELLN